MFVYTSFGFDLQLVMTIIPKGLPIDKTAGMKYHFLSNSYGLCTVCALFVHCMTNSMILLTSE